MTAEALRESIRRCLHKKPICAGFAGDFAVSGQPREERQLTPAAVLMPLVDRPAGFTVLLTQRTEHLDNHAGQISFPGGRVEQNDASHTETALRETEEEIGLHRRHVDVIGFMEPYQTITGFLVTPVVGFVEPSFELSLDTFEVAEAFEVPLAFILDSRHHKRHAADYRGERRQYYVIPYEDRYIWGATAAMLVNFANKLTHCSL